MIHMEQDVMIAILLYGTVLFLALANATKVLKLNGGTIDEFKKELQKGNEFWMIDFYAPWCSHCKKLEPVLGELLQDLESLGLSTMKIGKIDATANADVAKEYNVKSFPTILFINVNTDVVIKYEGPRTKEGFLALINRITTSPIININNIDDLSSYPKATVFFLLSLPTNFDSNIREHFEVVAKKHHAICYFAVINNNDIKSTMISKIEIGRSSNSNRVMPDSHDASIKDIEEFIHHHNHQLITNLESHNFKTLGNKNKTMIINIINSKDKPNGLSQQGFTAFESAVEMLSSDIVDRYIFCTLDLVKYRRFLKMYNAASAANLLFLDYGEDYYSSLDHPSKRKAWINADDIKDLIIEVVVDKRFTMKLFNKPGILKNLIMKLKNYYPYSLLCFVPLILLLVAIFYPSPEKKQKQKKF